MGIHQDKIRDDFHSLNNWLNKITVQSGQARYILETEGINLEKLTEEKERFIKLFKDMEEYALEIGEIVKRIHSSITL